MNIVQRIILGVWAPILASCFVLLLEFKIIVSRPGYRLWKAYEHPWVWIICFVFTGIFLFWYFRDIGTTDSEDHQES